MAHDEIVKTRLATQVAYVPTRYELQSLFDHLCKIATAKRRCLSVDPSNSRVWMTAKTLEQMRWIRLRIVPVHRNVDWVVVDILTGEHAGCSTKSPENN